MKKRWVLERIADAKRELLTLAGDVRKELLVSDTHVKLACALARVEELVKCIDIVMRLESDIERK